jgi:hypothetical protein
MDLPPGFYVDNISATRRDPNDPEQCAGPPSPQFSYMDLHGHLNPTEPFAIPSVIPGAAECLAIRVRYGRRIVGFVFDRFRQPVNGALMVAIPKSVWSTSDDAGVTPPDRYLTGTTDSTGYFELHGATEFLYPAKGDVDSTFGAIREGVPQEYHLYAFEDLDPNLIYSPDFTERFRNRETFVIREEERDTPLHPWRVIKVEQRTFANVDSCPGGTSPLGRQYCIFRSIPPEDTAEIR